jgi:hypothetical protein
MATRDEELDPWEEVAGYTDWTGFLVWNGASMVVWPQFGYRSLFEVATSDAVEPALTDQEISRTFPGYCLK